MLLIKKCIITPFITPHSHHLKTWHQQGKAKTQIPAERFSHWPHGEHGLLLGVWRSVCIELTPFHSPGFGLLTAFSTLFPWTHPSVHSYPCTACGIGAEDGHSVLLVQLWPHCLCLFSHADSGWSRNITQGGIGVGGGAVGGGVWVKCLPVS